MSTTEALATLRFDTIQRHAGRGPRYTSYPPATSWTEAVGPADLQRAVAELGERQDPPSLSVYVHMPFCPSMCWFCACNVLVTKRLDLADVYLDRVEREFEMLGPSIPQQGRTVQIHWGGGSPSYLTPQQMQRLYGLIRSRFNPTQDAEIALEVDPRITGPEHLACLRELGFNRLSMGVQDFDDTVQHAINRIQSGDMTSEFVDRCRAAGFHSLNMDLIYGLPEQTEQSFADTLRRVIEIRPDRLAIYGYAHVPWLKPFQRRIAQETIPGPDRRFALFRIALEKLFEAGYEYIGMDHFALPGDELATARRNGTLHRNFMGYSTRAGAELIGFGLSSISYVGGLYAQNEHKLNPYYALVDGGQLPVIRGYRLTKDDEIRNDVIQDLMCNSVIRKAAIADKHQIEFDKYFASELAQLAPLETDGLVQIHADRIEATFLGRILVRTIAMRFDAHLPKEMQGLARFSATV